MFAHGQLAFETLLQFVQSSYLPQAEVELTSHGLQNVLIFLASIFGVTAMTLCELISDPKVRKQTGAPSHAPSSSCSRTPDMVTVCHSESCHDVP